MQRFSDFSKEDDILDGKKVKIEKIFGREIIVLKYRIMSSRCVKNKMCLQLQFQLADTDSDKKYILFSNSEVLISQMKKYADKLPFITIIKKTNNYYTFS